MKSLLISGKIFEVCVDEPVDVPVHDRTDVSGLKTGAVVLGKGCTA